ncbi:tetratricopeptide repeat protein [Massilia glaciei]|nr:tetratricopeptide repeat protein [Massilia glaciei]
MKTQCVSARSTRSIAAAMTALAILAPMDTAQAAVFKDAQLEPLRDAGKYAELEQKAQARLKANAGDAEASAALSLALTFLDASDEKRLDAGAKQAKQCTERHPMVAVCHLAEAQNLSMQMLNMGMFKAMRMVGTLKASWVRTLELDPGSFVARVELAKLYLTVPGMMGGSVSKAKELEAGVRASQPETARIIRAYIAGEAKRWGEMEGELAALKPSKDSAMREEIRGATMQLAQVFLTDGKDLAKARSLYETLLRSEPDHAGAVYGLGRVHSSMGQPDQAIRNLEHAKTLIGADDYPIDHRLGDAYLAKGDKAQAKAAYARYIANKRANPANAEEARASLAKLR